MISAKNAKIKSEKNKAVVEESLYSIIEGVV
jgi:hypothetical protein